MINKWVENLTLKERLQVQKFVLKIDGLEIKNE